MTTPARRNSLATHPLWQQHYPHSGLWFDKYLENQKSDTQKMEPYVEHIRQVGSIKEPADYEPFFSRWRVELEKAGVQLREAETIGRLAAGLGNESVIENSLILHHTYGVPFIPGSSLKGTARAYAAQTLAGAWGKGSAAFDTLFGRQDRVGITVFYDALPIPGSYKIHNDVMTVHHPNYYQKDNGEAPADWDSPTPIPFLSVSGRFLIALHAPNYPEWASAAMGILQIALAQSGVGGKTSSGYGRFLFTPAPGYQRGTVKQFGLGSSQSYGFIIPDHGQEEIFVHRDHLRAATYQLAAGDRVDFKIITDRQKKQAQDVHLSFYPF